MSADSDFKELYSSTHLTLVRFIAYRIGDFEHAEDLAADVFRIAWEKHQAGTTVALPWLFATARNRIGNEYQRRKRDAQRYARIVAEQMTESETVSSESRDDELREAMERLRPAEQLVLQLVYWDDLSASETATFLGCSVPALWVRLSRARASLRSLLATRSTHVDRLQQIGGESHG